MSNTGNYTTSAFSLHEGVLGKLEKEDIFRIESSPEKTYVYIESARAPFSSILTKREILQLAEEFKKLAEQLED